MLKIRRILLVDDEEVITFGFSRVLSSPGVEVDSAQTAEDALAMIGSNTYNAAVIDLRLSNSTDLEGFSIVNSLKSSQKDCKIIVLTAFGEDKIRQQALAAGADIFLEKPVEPERIRELLKAFDIY